MMTRKTLKVGISAIFDPLVSPHARTFMRALTAARNHLAPLSQVEFLFADDGADPGVARNAARGFIEAGVDLVIGHFSSDAAMGVREIYRDAGRALLAPAATADAVTRAGAVFRICPPDHGLAQTVLNHCVAQGWRRVCVHSDGSLHGGAIADALERSALHHGVTLVEPGSAAAVIFCGRLLLSVAYLARHLEAAPSCPLILTDDAVSPHIPGLPAGSAPVHAVGFRPAAHYQGANLVCRQHRQLFGSDPETYFVESYAAFEILAALVQSGSATPLAERLATESFSTVLGTVQFKDGENPGAGHAVFALQEAGFYPVHEMSPGGPEATLAGDRIIPSRIPSSLAVRSLS